MEKINDDYIVNLFFGKRQLKHQIYKKYFSEEVNGSVYDYVVNRFKDFNGNIKETLFRIKYHVETLPVCKTCGKPVGFYGCVKHKMIYPLYCNCRCAQNDPELRDSVKNTCIKKYGKATNTEKYKKTCLEKYGVDNYRKTNQCKDKIKNTCLKRYGTDNYARLESHQDKLKSKECIEKRTETKRKNHTFNTSFPEKNSYELIKSRFPNTKYQYKSKEYPFCCDFYVPELDLYIECNYHWTHGGHPYDPANDNDKRRLESWKHKISKYYNNAIKVWTERDILKRETAEKNHLNYKEFWNYQEFEKFISDL